MLNLIDEHARECLAIHMRRRINSSNLIDVLADAMIEHGAFWPFLSCTCEGIYLNAHEAR
jgi:hypothetical protein